MSLAGHKGNKFAGCLTGLLLVSALGFFPFGNTGYASEAEPHASDSRKQPDPSLPQPDSPVIGGGVRNPPDIGAAGTGTVKDPVRSESPTEEPSIIPPITPPKSEQSEPIEAPLLRKPFGQPDVLPDKKPEPDSSPGVNQ